MFSKILIANRGEIACRVIRTARAMGMATVAVYSDADAQSLHVAMADEAIHIGASASSESYLRIDKILDAVVQSGAEAVHPGFGFLSENADFANALEAAGVAFIGPGVTAIAAMGDKITSKKLAERIGVNTIPGHTEALRDAEQAREIAAGIGCPVMIKASAGGGGKGMRIAWSLDEVADGFTSAANEARSSFGDDRVFIEKFIESPRHIEIQVLADRAGNCLYLGERECSIQRRHQKVIEEAPSPFIDPETRRAMGEQAVALAKAVDYYSAGTVEFVVDAQRNFYFLEMNTRLQVEHPVTEFITGLDLVEQMIRIAAGKTLTLRQDQVQLRGWALEARVYAEDPERNFMPSIGRLKRYEPPLAPTDVNTAVRVDTGVYEGGEISLYYDPMIAKLITHGETRAAAIDAMADALDDYAIEGVSHNLPFLSSLIQQPDFIRGELTTNFIAQHYPEGFCAEQQDSPDPARWIAIACSVQLQLDRRAGGARHGTREYWAQLADNQYRVNVRQLAQGFDVEVDGHTIHLRHDWRPGQKKLRVQFAQSMMIVQLEPRGLDWRLCSRGYTAAITVLPPRSGELLQLMPAKVPPDTSKFLLSPMPGLLVKLLVNEGEQVEIGQDLAVVEAMKMENTLCAERAGTVANIPVQIGDSLAVEQVIIEFA